MRCLAELTLGVEVDIGMSCFCTGTFVTARCAGSVTRGSIGVLATGGEYGGRTDGGVLLAGPVALALEMATAGEVEGGGGGVDATDGELAGSRGATEGGGIGGAVALVGGGSVLAMGGVGSTTGAAVFSVTAAFTVAEAGEAGVVSAAVVAAGLGALLLCSHLLSALECTGGAAEAGVVRPGEGLRAATDVVDTDGARLPDV